MENNIIENNITIGIEGLVGAGKTSICRELLDKIPNSIILHGGNLYRGIVFALMNSGIDMSKIMNNSDKPIDIKQMMDILKVELKIENRESVVYVDGKEINEEISKKMEEYKLSHLKELEAESIHIIREVAAEFENPVMLYSIGKDSSVMVRLAEKAFYPGKVPFPLMHIDSKWKFKEMIQFRDEYAKKHGWNLIVESNMEAFHAGVGPFTHGSKVHTDLMKTQALLHALDKYKFDAAFGGARRDEEKSRAKERIFSFRDKFHQWDPKNQRPELWDIYNARVHKGESIRVFPISNWTELDIWQYIRLENIPIVPLYYAKERPVINLDGNIIMADDDRLPEKYRDQIEMKMVRFRTLGCWPLTGAVESGAATIEEIVEEMMTTTKSERTTRVIDFDQEGSMEQKKREGYF